MKEIIETFFADITPSFSSSWKERIYEQTTKELGNAEISDDRLIRSVKKFHYESYEALFKKIRQNQMLTMDKSLNFDDREEIVQMLRIRFNNYFNNKKAIEERFFSRKTILNCILDFKRKKTESISINENIEKDSGFDIENFIDNIMVSKNSPTDVIYLSSSGDIYGEKSIALIKYLFVTQPKIFETHKFINSFPKIKFEYPSRDFIEKQYDFLRNIDNYSIDIPGYYRHYAVINARDRYYMNVAVEVLKECRNNFEQYLLPALTKTGKNENKIRKEVPLLSAVAVDKNDKIIKTAYKGETGCLGNHCEYTLFEEILTQKDKQSLVGGSLFVTLEPCNKRTFYVDKKNKKKSKVPCAVRCVESGIRKIFIGTFDPNIRVNWKGIEILKTGTYKFNLNKGKTGVGNAIEAEEMQLLIEDFNEKGYRIMKSNRDELIYQIGSPIEVGFFHPDLAIEIMRLNSDFISKHTDKAFPYSKIIL